MIPEQKALHMVLSYKRFWVAHFLVSLTVAALMLGWFWIPDSSALSVASSIAGALALIVIALLWIAVTFLYYLEPAALHIIGLAARRLPALLVWAAVGALLIWVSTPRVAWWVGWILLPAILAPVGWSVSVRGFAGFVPGKWPLRFLRAYPLIVITGIFVPLLLTQWHPALPGIALQTLSLAVRWTLAAAIAVTVWLFLAALLATLEEAPASTN